jgi:hypothetical protein
MAGKIKGQLGITKNAGNYESIRIDAGAELVVDDITDPDSWKALWDEIDSQVEAKLLEVNQAISS